MSNMLKFSEEEKLELGLVKKQPKMGESLVSFLMGDSDLWLISVDKFLISIVLNMFLSFAILTIIGVA